MKFKLIFDGLDCSLELFSGHVFSKNYFSYIPLFFIIIEIYIFRCIITNEIIERFIRHLKLKCRKRFLKNPRDFKCFNKFKVVY